MTNIPLVQGTAVPPSDFGQQSTYTNYQVLQTNVNDNDNKVMHATAVPIEEFESRRQNAPKMYQDVIWAIAFVAHLIVMLVVISIGFQSNVSMDSGEYGPLIGIVCLTGVASVVASLLSLSFMMNNAIILVQVALIFSVCTSLAIGIAGFMTGSLLMGILGLMSFAIGICYAMVVWNRIPFAAANLSTALTAVKTNLGLVVISLAFTSIAFGWTVIWFLGVGNALSGNNLVVVFLFVSLFFGNFVAVTTVDFLKLLKTFSISLSVLFVMHYRYLYPS